MRVGNPSLLKATKWKRLNEGRFLDVLISSIQAITTGFRVEEEKIKKGLSLN